ncbi:MAG: N-acetylmuramoyl-L-alanine amidase family protein [Luteolibacter sp.]
MHLKNLITRSATAIFAVLLLLTAAPSHAAENAGWKIIEIGGRDYVSVDSIKKFYNFTKLTRSGSSVVLENKKVEMKLKVGASECLMNNVKFVFSNAVISSGGKIYVSRMDLAKLIDPVLRPNFIKNAGDFKTVILDAGHGGKDPGATNSIGTEAGYNLKLAQRLKKLLESNGFKVKMVRESNRYYSLQERVNIANSVKGNAIFLSLHFNSGNNRSARGIETFTLSPPGVSHYGANLKASDAQVRIGNEHDSANIAFATALHGSVLRRLGQNTLDRGIKRARFSVLSGVRHPAVLFEGGFLSHSREARLIANEKYQEALAKGMLDAIARYRFAVGTKPKAKP